MGPAVIASTLTTIAVFLPIVFVEGIAGQLFKDQALTVTLALTASLIVSVTVIPMFSAWGNSGPRPVPRSAGAAATRGALAGSYNRLLRAAIARRWVTLGIAALLFGLSLGAVRLLDSELIPALSEGEFHFEVKLPEGTSLVATDRLLREMEATAAAHPGVQRHYATVGSRLSSGGMSLQTKAENLGMLHVVLANRGDDAELDATAAALRDAFATIPDLELNFGRPSYFNLRTPIEIVLYGEDLEELREM
jgi:HAE1 family hydrophobic/amphiphilic exporter-1